MMTLTVIALSLCALPEAAPELSSEAAQAYLAVAKDEQARGESSTALVAAREALRRDPANAEARQLFDALCSLSPRAADPWLEALDLLDDGDAAGALQKLELARRQADRGAEGSLVEGIALYELDRWEEARQALEQAAGDESLRAHASIYLGLIAWWHGDRAEAEARLRTAFGGNDPRLFQLTQDLLRETRRDGRISLSAGLAARYDTNVSLAPDGSASLPEDADTAAVVNVAASVRPFTGVRRLTFGIGGIYRAQTSLPQENFGALSATTRLDLSGGRFAGALEAGWESDWRGDVPYLNAPRLALAGRWNVAGPWSAKASYRARVESFVDPLYDGYSGVRHTGAVEGSWQGSGAGAWLSWRVERSRTQDRANDYVETGPTIQAITRLPYSLRGGVYGAVGYRDYSRRMTEDARTDWVPQGELWLDRDVGSLLTLRASVGANRIASSETTLSYTNVFGSVGLYFQQGWL